MKKRSKWPTFILLLFFFIGLSVLLYPTLSDFWNSKTQSKAIADYESILKNIPKEDYTRVFEEADLYNDKLRELKFPLAEYDSLDGYENLLSISDLGIMGYINVQKIGLELPLRHGTSEDVLAVGIGHVEGTSLPTGGIGNHCVVSAHRGLPSARLFTDLDRMEYGDTFTVKILDRTLTYEVDRIRIVAPEDTTELEIIAGEDHFTLLTCTPYGINTERLLVRGRRIDTVEHRTVYVITDGYQIDTLIVTPVVALPILFVLMLIVLFKPVKKPVKGEDE